MSDDEKRRHSASKGSAVAGDHASIQYGIDDSMGHLHRRLNNRQIQLIAAGGSIGTALFISIGGGLAKGGPGSLLIAYSLYSIVLALVNNSIAEMNTYMPVAGGFVRLAGYWVDDALGFLAGWNFFLYEALIIPFEITALTSVISFWNADALNPGPTAGICAAVIICYGLLNVLAVRFYGESEFWLSGGKLVLIFLLFAFTFVTMCGGNPQHDAYGFRHFSNPGSFATYLSQGDKGRFEGFLAALFSASFTVVGPEYISMVSAEAQRPTFTIKNAFKTVYYRFCIFFVVGALAVGICCAYNDPLLVDIYFGAGGTGNAASSPYVANGSAKVLGWLISIVTGGGLITFMVMNITFINYHRACVAQGVDRKTERPYYGYFQPYGAYIALVIQFVIVLTYGYYAFRPKFDVEVFFQNYSMQILAVLLFTFWKVFNKTKYIQPHEVDLVWERPQIEAYEATFTEPPVGFWTEMGQLCMPCFFKKTKRSSQV
ncbi:hypothetical protein FGSG_13562 [Fusarium graminearum PH-1]|uniref:hypothetical protein n=1 Tax=Gibberella zeae (strain ATCC MYA-4620 / CBS 123657 / FGSC 9075 / NRRL 31084 / PH-1) TaxID=229533 RepID=UPI00021F18B7|nr:hypothetical protein FGSG_13562 [Fusarium graminearum PH-1]ESU15903.1 hypothetical protein FGSG_13562 [Fusarium graminearum PH-1]|eukprot:XP_011328413.1 hypothetical protein FGSG_13562 [Fusarium graminearum PH-1]